MDEILRIQVRELELKRIEEELKRLKAEEIELTKILEELWGR